MNLYPWQASLAASSPGVGLGAAAAGALAAKFWCDRADGTAIAQRLAEVRRHAPCSCVSGMDPLVAIRQLLEAVDWCLAMEEQKLSRPGTSAQILNCVARGTVGLQVVEDTTSSDKAIERDFRRQLHRVRGLCAAAPVRGPSQKKGKGAANTKGVTHRRRNADLASLSVPGSTEAYERLFNPQWGTVRSKQGVCAALAYLVSSFLELRRNPQGLRDGQRFSLRLAVASLARHFVFDEDEDTKESERAPVRLFQPETGEGDDEEEDQRQEFRSAAMALLCVLDGALSWRPVDPLGWMGHCEDPESAVLAREKGLCSFPFLAGKLRRCLKKASSGCQATWRRFEVHLDAVRSRQLPDPWPWVWVLNEEASMLIRNKTKVPLRVELYKPRGLQPSPWAELPLLRPLYRLFYPVPEPVAVADIEPGIEWALRPKAKEGRDFKARLVTGAGVVVCSRSLRRGQSFDFEVPVPPRPAQLRVAAIGVSRRKDGHKSAFPTHTRGAVTAAVKALGGKEPDEDRLSVASTATPSLTSGRLSLASSSSGVSGFAREQMQAKMEERRRITEGLPPVLSSGAEQEELSPSTTKRFVVDEEDREQQETDEAHVAGLLRVHEGFRACLCPRCLHTMPMRRHRPLASVYSGGVSCDRCKTELLGELEEGEKESELDSKDAFCHCSRCWFDLCRSCAFREMQEVWWGGD
eukprot:TRINITY_DN97773_c0_g1_i1.p1 TRINITY_DN97773_c0_g1~~TRINITY_DN97773_c0_g1_i1.p1  ORF type:complete len:693 (-),score=134.54 TRINITY_DN97773_c0_g1_i1:53-2131(-)